MPGSICSQINECVVGIGVTEPRFFVSFEEIVLHHFKLLMPKGIRTQHFPYYCTSSFLLQQRIKEETKTPPSQSSPLPTPTPPTFSVKQSPLPTTSPLVQGNLLLVGNLKQSPSAGPLGVKSPTASGSITTGLSIKMNECCLDLIWLEVDMISHTSICLWCLLG